MTLAAIGPGFFPLIGRGIGAILLYAVLGVLLARLNRSRMADNTAAVRRWAALVSAATLIQIGVAVQTAAPKKPAATKG